ncbi:MAG: 2-hydroxy-3-oxopropionate reductase [Bacteroidales bacterium]
MSTGSSDTPVGFIGLGVMGRPMSLNLLKAGFSMMIYDIRPEAMKTLLDAGATAGRSPGHIGEQCPLIFTMLPDSPQVEEVIAGKDGILQGAKSGTLIVDMSSIAPMTAIHLAEKAATGGVHMLDAPVSGGEPKAVDGTLSIMVGGEESEFRRAEPLLRCMGSSVQLMGKIGSGNITKLANQIMVAIHLAAMSEAMVFAEKAGVDAEKVFHAIEGGLAGSQVLQAKMPLILERNFKPGGPIRMHTKDLINVRDTALEADAPIPLTVQVMEFMKALKSDGKAEDDHGGLIQYYEKLAGITVKRKS